LFLAADDPSHFPVFFLLLLLEYDHCTGKARRARVVKYGVVPYPSWMLKP
jgi:hypothetical protein